jgi:two-component system CheB/CheR fusion protein
MTIPFSAANNNEHLANLAPSHLAFPVVGIGGSAGGLQALIKLFENMPPDPGMAFVVILHLSPHHESNAAQILQQASSMPVRQVTTSVPIEVNHVYVIAPRSDLQMNDGHLQMASKDRAIGPAVAIDVFFRTLAQVHRTHAFCVVLSGTGSDGAVGIARVKAQGGVTLAQAPDDAEFGDMPRAAIASGMVDLVLPVAEMGQRLVDLWANAQRIQLPAADAALSIAQVGTALPLATVQDSETALQEIIALLRVCTRHDFRYYKRGTMLRRIERRLQVHGLPTLESYRDFLRSQPAEAVPLLQDMLISVTNFFRDPEAFDALAQDVMSDLVRHLAPGEQARVWVAGCATGEESYSLVMLMKEAAEAQGQNANLQVFATDIDERALGVARRGLYPNGIAADISPERLQRYFVSEENQYRIQAGLREQVLFATHNLLRDPPFSRLDLVCCRNLLIYLDPSAQANVLEMFHYALKPGGYLFLGSSESVDPAGTLFTPVDKKHRIYRAQGRAKFHRQSPSPAITERPVAASIASMTSRSPATPPQGMRQAAWRDPAGQMHLHALESILPPSVLIDAQHEILHLSPTAGRYMKHGGGVPSNNLLNNVEPELRLELRTALFQATQSNAKVRVQMMQTRSDGSTSQLYVVVYPLPQIDGDPARTLVVFDEIENDTQALGAEPEAASSGARDETQRLMLAQAEQEIKQLKGNLQDTLERSALSTEELKAANEELQAINEELRSATEELETSKEELQSMNEELTTVNFELRMKVEERGQINDDLQNLIASSEIATVFVDSALRVKRFTPQARTVFNLIDSDLGRPLLDITHRLNHGDLIEDAQAVFKNLRPVERRVTTLDERHLLARLLPYRTVGDRIEGIVLTFIDITELRLAEEKVHASEERLRVAAATTNDFAIITTDPEGLVTAWNTGAERIFGYAEGEMLTRSISEIFTPEDRVNGVPETEQRLARETGRAEDERWHLRKDGSTFYCSGVMTQLPSTAGPGFVKIARDMTGSKRHDLARENLLLKEQQESNRAKLANDMKDQFLAVMSHELKQPLNLIQVNAELLTRLPETKVIPSALRIGTTIQRSVESQSRIINDLLDLSRIRTGKLRLNPEKVDLCEIVVSLAKAASADIERKRITLNVDSPASVPCYCDHVRVEQIVWNLLNNAVKFTPEGGRITLALERSEESARITVSDSGLGIAAEALPHIFELFSQVDPQATRGNGGLGIGLSLVQELAKAHGGDVSVASEGLGEGSTFSVWLPLSMDDTAALSVPKTNSVSLKGWRILTVDDDVDSLNVFAALLRIEGATVDPIASSTQALELLTTTDYDLMISDLSMPDMDGCVLIAEVRRRKPDRKLLAISMSGFGRDIDAVRAKAAGFDVHIAKPSSISQIKVALSQFLNESSRAIDPLID